MLYGETEEEEYGDDDARSFPGAPRERRTREARLYLHTQRAKCGVSGYALLATPVIGESRRRQCVRHTGTGKNGMASSSMAETCSRLKSFSGELIRTGKAGDEPTTEGGEKGGE